MHSKLTQISTALFLHHHAGIASRIETKACKLFQEAEHTLDAIKQLEEQIESMKEHRIFLLNQYGVAVDQAKGQRARTSVIKNILS